MATNVLLQYTTAYGQFWLNRAGADQINDDCNILLRLSQDVVAWSDEAASERLGMGPSQRLDINLLAWGEE